MSAEDGTVPPGAKSGPRSRDDPDSRPFALVLAGGGARGFAHVGVLRELERQGFRPSALVGVSMGAVVAAAYALNPDWYVSLLRMDVGWIHAGPRLVSARAEGEGLSRDARRAWRYGRAMWRMITGWGASFEGYASALELLRTLTRGRDLADGRLPVAVCATDLGTGERVVLRDGDAAEAAYASSALAGVVPPLIREGALLADGAYTDLAPVDVARSSGRPVVLAVDPGQDSFAGEPQNGLQALVRAFEICHTQHARLRFADADLVLRPPFRRTIDVLEFDARRECVAAGVRAVRAEHETLVRLLRAREERRESA